jgi:predicted phosphodiesterase
LARNLWVCLFDIHHPKVHKPTLNAAREFIACNRSKVAGVYLGGDQFDNEEISHHNSNKPLYKPAGSYDRNTRSFDAQVLTPIEEIIPRGVEKIWQIGNHDDWEYQFIESHPELQGTIERPILLNLEKRGWQVIPCGGSYEIGKLTLIHGETLSGVGNQASGYHAKKAVETYAGSVLYGHMHAPQSYTKVLPHHRTDKWQGTCSPIVGATNPGYLRNRPTAWLNGFTIVETHGNGLFNVYPVIVVDGQFSFAGQVYGKKK